MLKLVDLGSQLIARQINHFFGDSNLSPIGINDGGTMEDIFIHFGVRVVAIFVVAHH